MRETSGKLSRRLTIFARGKFLISSTVIAPSTLNRPDLVRLNVFKCAPQPRRLADVVRVGADIKTFAAKTREIDFRRGDAIDGVAIDMHESRLALDHFSLSRQFIKRNTALFDRRNHRRHLVEIAPVFLESRADIFLGQIRDRTFLDDFVRRGPGCRLFCLARACQRIPCPRS